MTTGIQGHQLRIVVIGAGCFGASTAYHLLHRGYQDVTILDRSPSLPAVDAASNDINRIVRSSYADPFYAQLAREAILSWRDSKRWGDSYHESGVIILGSSNYSEEAAQPMETPYAQRAFENDLATGANVKQLGEGDSILDGFPASVRRRLASFKHTSGYINHDGGWVDAKQALALLIQQIEDLQGKIILSKQVLKLVRHQGRTTGVECSDGSVFHADLVILATGSWTPSTFSELSLSRVCLATGQPIATIQLTGAEADVFRQCPVVLDFSTGFYVFPPNENNLVKMAIHGTGYTHRDSSTGISSPRTVTSNPVDGLSIPKEALRDLRESLKAVYPDLARKSIRSTRLCWYNDSPDEDWVIGKYPCDAGLVLATGGSGHAYKFLPVIGRLVVDLVEGRLDSELVTKFAVDRPINQTIHSRTASGRAKALELDQLCSAADLDCE